VFIKPIAVWVNSYFGKIIKTISSNQPIYTGSVTTIAHTSMIDHTLFISDWQIVFIPVQIGIRKVLNGFVFRECNFKKG
jgi:hypothetical protein